MDNSNSKVTDVDSSGLLLPVFCSKNIEMTVMFWNYAVGGWFVLGPLIAVKGNLTGTV